MERLFYEIGIPSLSRYEISMDGLIRRKEAVVKYPKHGILVQCISRTGYFYLNLIKDNGERKTYTTHRLIALTFIPNPENKPFINHKNGIKTDNRIENLEWCTAKENSVHAYKNKLIVCKKGEENGVSKLSNSEVLDIFNMGGRHCDIALKFSISQKNVSFIKSGVTWSHLTGKVYKRKRITPEMALNIKKDKSSGKSIKELSKIYSKTENQINQICRQWKNI